MKINQSAVNTQPKIPVRENTEKAGVSSGDKAEDKVGESGVMLDVSQRNVVEVSDDEGMPEKPVGGIKQLLDKLMAAPENTATLHAGLSPEKVLQLLA